MAAKKYEIEMTRFQLKTLDTLLARELETLSVMADTKHDITVHTKYEITHKSRTGLHNVFSEVRFKIAAVTSRL